MRLVSCDWFNSTNFQLKRFAPKTVNNQLAIDEESQLPILQLEKCGIRMQLEEVTALSWFLYKLKHEMSKAEDKKFNMIELAEIVWLTLESGIFPSKGYGQSNILFPLGDKGLRLKIRYFTNKDGDTIFYGIQLFRFEGEKCTGVGLELTAEEVCSVLFHLSDRISNYVNLDWRFDAST